MTLTLNERIILRNQYHILSLLDKDNADFYERALEVLDYGYELAYSWYFTNRLSRDTISAETCKEVLDILSMFERLESSYESLDDKSGIDAFYVKFRGFSGNDESDHYAFATFLHSEKKYTYLNWDHKGNSHFPVLPTYRRMLSIWREKGSEDDSKLLSKQALLDIIGTKER